MATANLCEKPGSGSLLSVLDRVKHKILGSLDGRQGTLSNMGAECFGALAGLFLDTEVARTSKVTKENFSSKVTSLETQLLSSEKTAGEEQGSAPGAVCPCQEFELVQHCWSWPLEPLHGWHHLTAVRVAAEMSTTGWRNQNHPQHGIVVL